MRFRIGTVIEKKADVFWSFGSGGSSIKVLRICKRGFFLEINK